MNDSTNSQSGASTLGKNDCFDLGNRAETSAQPNLALAPEVMHPEMIDALKQSLRRSTDENDDLRRRLAEAQRKNIKLGSRLTEKLAEGDAVPAHEGTVEPSPAGPETAHLRALTSAELERGELQSQLTRYLVERTDVIRRLRTATEGVDWLTQIAMEMLAIPFWWSLLPRTRRHRLLAKRLARRGFFNPDEYLRRYPDVMAAGMDPLRHYIMHGRQEGRLP